MADRPWVDAYPAPACAAVASLPANLAAAMVLVDYAAHGLSTPTPWPQAALGVLSVHGLARLRRLRAVLAHGTVLREFLLDRLAPDHPAQRHWEELRALLAGLPPADVGDLVAEGVLAGLAFYREEMEPLPEVEAVLRRLGTRDPQRPLLEDPAARRAALEALLLSWGVREPREALDLALDAAAFRDELVALWDELWARAFARFWEEGRPRVEEAAERARRLLQQEPPRPAGERVFAVTGLQPPLELEALLRPASHLLFVPCLHLGRSLSITRAGLGWAPARFGPDRFRVFYEPPPPGPGAPAEGARAVGLMDFGHLAPALAALGDPARLAILQLLRREGERFAAQVAEELGLHPSTVSRHLAQLEAAGLVRVRREGSAKYYRLDRERLRAVARMLEDALG